MPRRPKPNDELLAHSMEEFKSLKLKYPDRKIRMTFIKQLQLPLEEGDTNATNPPSNQHS
jgi:hypothetical protein